MNDAFIAWAREAFRAEIQNGFRHARTFDGFLSRCKLLALKNLPKETLQLLARALPTGAGYDGEGGSAAFRTLPPDEKVAVARFRENVHRIWEKKFPELSRLIEQQQHKQAEAKRIRSIGIETVRQIGAKWGYKSFEIDGASWCLSCRKRWGEIRVHWNFSLESEFDCRLFIYDTYARPIRTHDHYLGILGIGPSIWAIEGFDSCSEKIWKASEFVSWYAEAYAKIMEEAEAHDRAENN